MYGLQDVMSSKYDIIYMTKHQNQSNDSSRQADAAEPPSGAASLSVEELDDRLHKAREIAKRGVDWASDENFGLTEAYRHLQFRLENCAGSSGGEKLVGKAEHLPAGTYWPALLNAD